MDFKKITATAAVSATMAVGVVVAAGAANPAHAGWKGDYLVSGAAIRSGHSTTGTTIYGRGYPGQKLCATTIWDGGGYDWIYHKNLQTGVTGWTRNDLAGVYYPIVGC